MEKRANTTHLPSNTEQDHYQEGSYGLAKLSYKHRFTEREWLEGEGGRQGDLGKMEEGRSNKSKAITKQ